MEFYIIKKLLFILLILIPFLTTIITFCENPIYALLSFNILLLNFLVILHILGIHFLSLLLFLIYFGGILILFIFAILLLNLRNFKPIFWNNILKSPTFFFISCYLFYQQFIGNPSMNLTFSKYFFDLDLNSIMLIKESSNNINLYYFLQIYEYQDIKIKSLITKILSIYIFLIILFL